VTQFISMNVKVKEKKKKKNVPKNMFNVDQDLKKLKMPCQILSQETSSFDDIRGNKSALCFKCLEYLLNRADVLKFIKNMPF
jgi:hypothetical protein